MIKVCAISDLHGCLPSIPTCDLLLIAGDVCPVWDHDLEYQEGWLKYRFHPWLYNAPAGKIVMTWGNHDLIAEQRPDLVPTLPCDILVDDMVEWKGLRIYGLPWQPRFHKWAFNLGAKDLVRKFQAIPECDIVVSHAPPRGFGDRNQQGERCGVQAFTARLGEIQPRLAVYGHIHEGYGSYRLGKTDLWNVSLMTVNYLPSNDLVFSDWPLDNSQIDDILQV